MKLSLRSEEFAMFLPGLLAFSYNLLHHIALATALWFTGFYLANPPLQLIGVILFSHSAFDRILGYGLKYEQGFKFTHLGEIGK